MIIHPEKITRTVLAFVLVSASLVTFPSLCRAGAVTGFESCIYGTCASNPTVGCPSSVTLNEACTTTNSSNPGNVIASFEGTTYEIAQTKAGNLLNGTKGYLTLPNQLMTIVQQLITAGTITSSSIGTTGVTASISSLGSPATLHMVFSQNPVIDNVTYAYDMKMWMCNGNAASCNSASLFYEKLYMAWSVSADGLTNTGVLNLAWGQSGNPGSTTGPQGSMSTIYDVGAASAHRYVTAIMYDTSGGSPAQSQRFDATKSGTVLNMTDLWGQFASYDSTTRAATGSFTSSHRDAVTFDSSALAGAYSGEGYTCNSSPANTGACSATSASPSVQMSATSDAASVWQCFTAAATTDDFAYTPTTSGQTCSLAAVYPSESLTALQTAVYSPQTAAVIDGNFLNGMLATPPNI